MDISQVCRLALWVVNRKSLKREIADAITSRSVPANGVLAVIMNFAAEAHAQPGASCLQGEGTTFVVQDGVALFVFFWLIPSSVSTLAEVLVRPPNPTGIVEEPVAEKNTVTFPIASAVLIAGQLRCQRGTARAPMRCRCGLFPRKPDQRSRRSERYLP